MGEVVKRSWLITLYFIKSKYEYSNHSTELPTQYYIAVSIVKSVAMETLDLGLSRFIHQAGRDGPLVDKMTALTSYDTVPRGL